MSLEGVLDFSMKTKKSKEETSEVEKKPDSELGIQMSPISSTSQLSDCTPVGSLFPESPSPFSFFPTLPHHPNLFPTTSLALSALHRRRRRTSNSDPHSPSSPNKKSKAVPQEKKDDSYWERRRKNNEAAKRSRDSRKAKEDEIAMRAALLEQENLKLKAQIHVLKNEMTRLHYLLFNQQIMQTNT